MNFGSVIVVCGRQWSRSVDVTSKGDITIPESFDGSNEKLKKINTANKHRERQRFFLNTP